jgi:hypothetical protein
MKCFDCNGDFQGKLNLILYHHIFLNQGIIFYRSESLKHVYSTIFTKEGNPIQMSDIQLLYFFDLVF